VQSCQRDRRLRKNHRIEYAALVLNEFAKTNGPVVFCEGVRPAGKIESQSESRASLVLDALNALH